jgi:hypothetical protein
MNVTLALAKIAILLAKAIEYYSSFIPPAKAGGNSKLGINEFKN